jgi:hypothetical protein
MSICTCYHNFRIDIVNNDITISAWVNCDIWMRDSSTVFISTQKLHLRGQALQIYPQGYISMKTNLISEGHSNTYQILKISLKLSFLCIFLNLLALMHIHILVMICLKCTNAHPCVFSEKKPPSNFMYYHPLLVLMSSRI